MPNLLKVAAFVAVTFGLIRFNIPLFDELVLGFRSEQAKAVRVYDAKLGFELWPNMKLSLAYWMPFRPMDITTTPYRGRVGAVPVDPKAPIIAILGASETFGVSVGNEETYAYRLGVLLRDRFQVENRSVPGWTLYQSFNALRLFVGRRIQTGYPLPVHVLFAWTPGQPDLMVFSNVPGKSKYIPPHLSRLGERRKAIEMQGEMLRDAWNFCQEHGIKMTVVILSQERHWYKVNAPYEEVLRSLRAFAIPHLDLSSIKWSQNSPFDVHPTREWHAQVAEALAAYFK